MKIGCVKCIENYPIDQMTYCRNCEDFFCTTCAHFFHDICIEKKAVVTAVHELNGMSFKEWRQKKETEKKRTLCKYCHNELVLENDNFCQRCLDFFDECNEHQLTYCCECEKELNEEDVARGKCCCNKCKET